MPTAFGMRAPSASRSPRSPSEDAIAAHHMRSETRSPRVPSEAMHFVFSVPLTQLDVSLVTSLLREAKQHSTSLLATLRALRAVELEAFSSGIKIHGSMLHSRESEIKKGAITLALRRCSRIETALKSLLRWLKRWPSDAVKTALARQKVDLLNDQNVELLALRLGRIKGGPVDAPVEASVFALAYGKRSLLKRWFDVLRKAVARLADSKAYAASEVRRWHLAAAYLHRLLVAARKWSVWARGRGRSQRQRADHRTADTCAPQALRVGRVARARPLASAHGRQG